MAIMKNLNNKMENKSIGLVLRIIMLICFCILIIPLCGCDGNILEGIADDDSFEAKLEEARMALDDEEYAKAKEILTKLRSDYPDDEEVLQYLSNANAGLTGIDTFNLLETIDELDELGTSGSIDMIGLMLGTDTGTLTSTDVDEKLANLNEAISTLKQIENPDEDQQIQLGMLSVTHLALTVADIVLEDKGDTDITLTEDGLNQLYAGSTADISDVSTDTLALESLANDINNITASIDALESISGEGNDLSTDFETFKNEIDTDGEDGISVTDLNDYINSL